jgi:hypothetical protein
MPHLPTIAMVVSITIASMLSLYVQFLCMFQKQGHVMYMPSNEKK